MAAVMLNPGKYWVGNPKLVDEHFLEGGSFVCEHGEMNDTPYVAFRYGAIYVAAIPVAAFLDSVPTNVGAVMTFDVETLFETDGTNGRINGVELGVLGGKKFTEDPRFLSRIEGGMKLGEMVIIGAGTQSLITPKILESIAIETGHEQRVKDLTEEVLSNLPHVTGTDSPVHFPKPKKKSTKKSTPV